MAISKIRIFPSIGIARLGNSNAEYFLGRAIPGLENSPGGGYRDSAGLIKRQGARFHLFAYDDSNKPLGEITAEDADITWTVHVANTKAASEWFHPKSETRSALRNARFTGDRHQLKLDPGEVSVSGKNPNFEDLQSLCHSRLRKTLRSISCSWTSQSGSK